MTWRNRVAGLEYHKPGEIEDHPQQWRVHPKAQAAALQGVLEEVGIAGALLVYRSEGKLVAIDGHLRKGLNPDVEWPCLVLDVTDEEAQKLLATFDPIGALAVADAEVLADLLAQVRTEDEAVQRLLDEVASEAGIGLEIGKDPGPQLLDKAEELQEKWQVAPGDVWQCGDLWLICGDCREADTWERLLSVAGVTKVHGVFTSPPYAEQRKKQYNGIATDKYVDWWEPVQENVRRYLADDGSFFVNLKAHCEDGERVLYVMDLVLAMKRRWGWRWVDEFIWRHSGFPGGWRNRFKNEFEPIFHFDREGHSLYVQIISEENAAEILNEPIDDVGSIHHFSILRRIKFYPRCVGKKSNEAFDYSPNNAKLWGTGNVGLGGPGLIRKTGIARPGNFVNIEYSQGRGTSHAAVFPVALPAFFIRAFSEKGDVWCDNFSGSGTTGVAAFQHGRRFIGIELVDRYCAVTLERWHQMTGGEPRLLECSSFSTGGG